MMRTSLLPVLFLTLAAFAQNAPETADVIVYGGNSAGTIAAVQAGRMKKNVILIEPGKHIGGLSASGLGLTDKGAHTTIGGISREFYQRIYKYYEKPEAWKFQTRDEYLAWLPKGWAVTFGPGVDKPLFTFEPHVAEAIFNDMVREAGVKLIYGERLDLKNGVEKSGDAIKSITMESGRRFTARVFIDATYEGDLMAKAGVKYKVGREANSQYGETLNGCLPSGALPFKKVDPYVVPGDKSSGLLPRVDPQPPGKPGEGDNRNQAYNFRVCLTNVPQNRVPFAKPADFNPLEYELLSRWMATMPPFKPGKTHLGGVALRGDEKDLVIIFSLVPNLKTDSNNGSEFGSDYYGKSYDWADGDYALREKRWNEHKTYIAGLLWYLANDPRCPEPIRQEMQTWGLAKDEFTDSGNWPFQLYVREARRMVSDYVVTEHDARLKKVAEDPVALASYHMDSHGVSLFLDENGVLCREKGFYVPGNIFGVSYRALCPPAEQCTNLLVPVCLSSSHAAYGPLRMEPVFMMLGQAAGTAASLAVDRKVAVQQLPYSALRQRLLADKAILVSPRAKAEK